MAGEGASVGQLLESDLSQSKKSELLEICSSERCPCLKGAQLVKWGRILGGTVWSQDPWGQRKNGSVLWGRETGFVQQGWKGALSGVCHKPHTAAWSRKSSLCGGPAKGRNMVTLLLPLGQISEDKHCSKSADFGSHKREDSLFLRFYWRKGTRILQLWLEIEPLYPLKRHRKPSGNKNHIEQAEAAYTEPGSLARGGTTPPKRRHLRISPTDPSPRRPAGTKGEHQVYGGHRPAKL